MTVEELSMVVEVARSGRTHICWSLLEVGEGVELPVVLIEGLVELLRRMSAKLGLVVPSGE